MVRYVFAGVAAILALAAPGRVYAHAYLERSSPAGNTVVEAAPRRVQIWFSERPELRFSEVTVYSADGDRLPHGPLIVPADNPRSLVFDLEPVPSGTYTIAWKTLSADDGHTSAGAFAFAVGLDQPAPTAASIFVPAGQAADTGRPGVLSVLGRWLTYGGAALLGGGPFCLMLVVWPALRRLRRPGQNETPAAFPTEAAERLARLQKIGLTLALTGSIAGLLGQALAISGEDSAALRMTLVDLLLTRSGLLFWARLLALAVAALALRQLAHSGWTGPRARWTGALVLLSVGCVLLSVALGAHAAATPIWTNFTITADWLHLTAMSVWLGGLAVLGLVVPSVVSSKAEHERRALLADLVGGFSRIALWSVAVLALTGIYQSWVHVGEIDGLTRTGYGQTLLIKLVLVLPLVLLGALNLLVHRPRLSRAAAGHARQAAKTLGSLAGRLRLAVRAELVLGAAVLLATGVLTNLPPARDALVQLGRPQTRSSQLTNLKVTLAVDPAVAGLNTYDVAVAEASGRAVDDAQRVALRFRHTEHEMGDVEAVLQPRGEGHYTTQGSFLSMAGLWEVDVRVRLPGREDLSIPLEIPAADPTAINLARASQTPSLGTSLLLGIELLAGAIVLAIAASRLRLPLPRPLNRLIPRLTAALLAAVGSYFLAIGVVNDLTPTAALANPIPVSRSSLERGREIYEQYCLTCHGPEGRGDGPLGRVLRPRPADLQTHTTAHTEGQLYWWISKGFAGSAMPAFEDRLTEEERWHVLNFIVQAFRP